MKLANFSHSDMFDGNLLGRDYVNPALFTLMDQFTSSDLESNISSFEGGNGGINHNYPSMLYSTFPMIDYLEDMNQSSVGHNSIDMEDDLATEEQLKWLYSGTAALEDNIRVRDGLLGSNLKRPHMATMEEVQVTKKKCSIRINSSSSKKDPQSIAAKDRRERISKRLKILQELVPNGTKVDLVTMLEKAISYVKFLQLQVKVLASDELW